MTKDWLLPSWNDTGTRRVIAGFLGSVTEENSSNRVSLEERVAIFDNDGTFWSEKLMPTQLDFILSRLAAMVAFEDPATRQAWDARTLA